MRRSRVSSLVALGLACMVGFSVMAQQIPSTANSYRAPLIRVAHAEWGLDAPVSTFAGQIQQESGWNSAAVSRVGAQGMAQFMPATAKWWCSTNSYSLADCQPRNPAWAMRALVQYDHWLYNQISALNDCHRMAFALSSYNGGLGWVYRDQKRALSLGLDSHRYFSAVERVNAGRTAANFKENRDYPQRILFRYEPLYITAGWGRGSCDDQAVP